MKLGLLTLPVIFTSTKLHILVCPGFLVMIWKARDICYVVFAVSPVLAWWAWACFGCSFLYLFGAVSSLLLHPAQPLWTFRSTLPVLVSQFGFPVELHTDIWAVLIQVLSTHTILLSLLFGCSFWCSYAHLPIFSPFMPVANALQLFVTKFIFLIAEISH